MSSVCDTLGRFTPMTERAAAVAEGIGVGADTRFTGKINKVTLEVR